MFFLKYRPQTIEDLDSEKVKEQLKKILNQKKIPQAFLFSGPKGVGKTSAARILAKAVNCPEPKKNEPCNQCHVCQEISRGSSLDVLEIDAASNRGIDDIRQLKEKVGLGAVKGKYKVYIIDEVHMLTKEAFNALLKTLEEPPGHVIFVLCTTDPGKIIATVLSRLLRIDFKKGNYKEMERSLDKVVRGEGLKLDSKAKDSIIRLADGSFRDGQKILEGLFLSLGKKIKWDQAKELLGEWEKQRPEKVLELIGRKDLGRILPVTESLAQEGADFSDYLGQILNLIQKIILIKAKAEEGNQEEKSLATFFELKTLVKMARVFSKALIEQKTAVVAQLPLQLAVIEIISGSKSNSPAKTKSFSQDGEKNEPAIKKKTFFEKKSGRIDLKKVEDQWSMLLEAVKPMNHSVAALLRAARPKEVNGDTIILEVFYQFHKDKLEENRNRLIVEGGLEKICAFPFKVRCVLGMRKREEEKIEPIKEEEGEKGEDLYQIAKEIFG